MRKYLLVIGLLAMVLLIAGCPAEEAPIGDYQDGTYSGSAEGYIDVIELEVVVESGFIAQIDIISHDETPGISEPAFDETIEQIIENQSTEGVEAVSGATVTSEAVISAVDEALAGAR